MKSDLSSSKSDLDIRIQIFEPGSDLNKNPLFKSNYKTKFLSKSNFKRIMIPIRFI